MPDDSEIEESERPGAELQSAVRELLERPAFRGRVQAAILEEWSSRLGVAEDSIVAALVSHAAERSHAPISSFAVGCVAIGDRGDAFLGTNVEIVGASMAATVHAEQCAISVARSAGAAGIRSIRVGPWPYPCGHCRQFLAELGSPDLAIRVPGGGAAELASLLPEGFGPSNLGVDRPFFGGDRLALALRSEVDELAAAALDAARTSWAPYSRCPAGAAVETADGEVYVGSAIESAAFNPTLGAFEAALAALVVSRGSLQGICRAVLVAVPGRVDPVKTARSLLSVVAPGVELRSLECLTIEEDGDVD